MSAQYPLNSISFSVAKMIEHAAVERGTGEQCRRVLPRDDLDYIAEETGLAPLDIIKIAKAIEIGCDRLRLVPRLGLRQR